MRFGSRVVVTRGGGHHDGPGGRREVRGVLVGARGHRRYVRLTEDDSRDTVGWRRVGDVGWWCASAVREVRP